ncbi:MAG: hypothetical protein C0173_03415 [Desulfurella sp.]|uniref:YgaP family membrane protein n=1 Tax=Desulfurella sp. TaxID=1962857 RepID=UPI000CC835C4|nr:DUF2892 domain-containing protein [Desulfurella sp.]PMP91478.1 MAG: hypothetical protein C0173_03415 [Desulfurella sp.]
MKSMVLKQINDILKSLQNNIVRNFQNTIDQNLQTNIATWDRVVRAILGIGLVLYGIKQGGVLFVLLSIGLILLAKEIFAKKINKYWFDLIAAGLVALAIAYRGIWFDISILLTLSIMLYIAQGGLLIVLLGIVFIIFLNKLPGSEILNWVLEHILLVILHLIGISFSIHAILSDVIGMIGLFLLETAALGFCPIYSKIYSKKNY